MALFLKARNGGTLEIDGFWWAEMSEVLDACCETLVPKWIRAPFWAYSPFSFTEHQATAIADVLEEGLDDGDLLCPLADVHLREDSVREFAMFLARSGGCSFF